MNEGTAGSAAEEGAATVGPETKSGQRSLRRVLVESVLLGIFTGVGSVVFQRLIWGDSSMPISVAFTVVVEILYFKTIAKRI